MDIQEQIDEYLRRGNELAQFCSQNGWIDSGSLRAEIVSQDARQLELRVYFQEVVMEGSGCTATTIPCFGRLRFPIGEQGRLGRPRAL